MGKGKRIIWVIKQNKPLWAVFSLLISLILVVGSTYSWVTYSDDRINSTKANTRQLSAIIEEDFKPNLIWSPGSTTKKVVTVKNNGKVPAIVRVSLFEIFARFEIDVTDNIIPGSGLRNGNGSLKRYNSSSGTDLNKNDLTTWQVDNTLKIADGNYYKVVEAIVNFPDNIENSYNYQGERGPSLSNLTINFNASKIYTEAPPSGTTNYWLYENGYFFYSEVLEPDEETVNLIESLSLNAALANRYKGVLYQLIPQMDAHDRTTSLLSDWQLNTGPVFDLYSTLVR